jgi:hypothetical protein
VIRKVQTNGLNLQTTQKPPKNNYKTRSSVVCDHQSQNHHTLFSCMEGAMDINIEDIQEEESIGAQEEEECPQGTEASEEDTHEGGAAEDAKNDPKSPPKEKKRHRVPGSSGKGDNKKPKATVLKFNPSDDEILFWAMKKERQPGAEKG